MAVLADMVKEFAHGDGDAIVSLLYLARKTIPIYINACLKHGMAPTQRLVRPIHTPVLLFRPSYRQWHAASSFGLCTSLPLAFPSL